jgi:hypothetical protein
MAKGHHHRKGCKCGFCTKSHKYTKRRKRRK